MTGPDRIWATVNGSSTDVISGLRGLIGGWHEHGQGRRGAAEYIRRDPAVLAALPEVQALIAGVLELAASMIEDNVRHAKDLGREIWPIPDLRTLTPADAIAARDAMIAEAVRAEREKIARMLDGVRDLSEDAAAIRKRGEG